MPNYAVNYNSFLYYRILYLKRLVRHHLLFKTAPLGSCLWPFALTLPLYSPGRLSCLSSLFFSFFLHRVTQPLHCILDAAPLLIIRYLFLANKEDSRHRSIHMYSLRIYYYLMETSNHKHSVVPFCWVIVHFSRSITSIISRDQPLP